MSDELLDIYPALRSFSAQLGDLPRLEVPEGAVLFSENQVCAGLPLLVSGEVRVCRSSGEGRSLEATGLIGWCPPYAMLGISTCKTRQA